MYTALAPCIPRSPSPVPLSPRTVSPPPPPHGVVSTGLQLLSKADYLCQQYSPSPPPMPSNDCNAFFEFYRLLQTQGQKSVSSSAQLLYYLSSVHWKLFQYARCRELIEQCIQLCPWNEAYRASHIRVLWNLKDQAELSRLGTALFHSDRGHPSVSPPRPPHPVDVARHRQLLFPLQGPSPRHRRLRESPRALPPRRLHRLHRLHDRLRVLLQQRDREGPQVLQGRPEAQRVRLPGLGVARIHLRPPGIPPAPSPSVEGLQGRHRLLQEGHQALPRELRALREHVYPLSRAPHP